ncbi:MULTISPECIES: DUF5302 domain-containing protein [Streptomyces]|uniref:DUF5302 domain-containing protein n=2 Tax=Streptomyces TaxID=1883 RepID=A0A7H1QCY2_9ACTN|nr:MULTISPECIES: DUF5302 domain-containing protein [Streptomyces]MBA9050660.1 hypothetical protein [Streptomyces murinus]QNT98162.1 hypothetical protein HEP81_07934 [Streptomyces griseofuscus]BAC76516.1 hypothetical protein [Streptomyces rochei]
MTETPNKDHHEDEVRAKFKEALARKSQASQAKHAQEEARSKTKNMSGRVGQKRNFRRKAG